MSGAHDLPSVDVILHGGEPLLAGTEWLTELAGSLRARVPAQVNIMRPDQRHPAAPAACSRRSAELGIRVGVSLDGDAEATGRHRLYPNGRNSFDDVADGLRLLGSPEFREIYGGILCTIDVQQRPDRHLRGAAASSARRPWICCFRTRTGVARRPAPATPTG